MNTQMNALIVDDASPLRLIIKRFLSRMGFKYIREACNGQEAYEVYKTYRPDLVLLDINMPVMDGIRTLEEIRKVDTEALVIMLTSLTTRRVVEESADAGATYFIRKDLPIDEIEALITDLLEEKESNTLSVCRSA